MDAGIQDTAAYRIIRQILDHTRGEDLEVEDRDILAVCRAFGKAGGSWKSLLDGDMSGFRQLEDSIDGVLKAREMMKMATRIAAKTGKVF